MAGGGGVADDLAPALAGGAGARRIPGPRCRACRQVRMRPGRENSSFATSSFQVQDLLDLARRFVFWVDLPIRDNLPLSPASTGCGVPIGAGGIARPLDR